MATDRVSALNDLLRMETDRPLGDVTLTSNTTRSAVSGGLHEAAANLLVKASRALESGDPERAEGYLSRAVRLPFDEYEGLHPAWAEAGMCVFTALTDALETCSPGDHRWLEAALEVLPTSGEHARTEFLHALATINHEWPLEPRESRRVKAAIGKITWSLELETSPPQEDAEHVAAILEILTAVESYFGAVERTFG